VVFGIADYESKARIYKLKMADLIWLLYPYKYF